MARAGPRKIREYSLELKLTAVRLSEQPGTMPATRRREVRVGRHRYSPGGSWINDPSPRHSALNALIGSAPLAARAGTTHATNATVSRTPQTMTYVNPSVGDTP